MSTPVTVTPTAGTGVNSQGASDATQDALQAMTLAQQNSALITAKGTETTSVLNAHSAAQQSWSKMQVRI
jgi:hypothetical protein